MMLQQFSLEETACGEAGYFMMCGNAVLGYLLEEEAKLPPTSIENSK